MCASPKVTERPPTLATSRCGSESSQTAMPTRSHATLLGWGHATPMPAPRERLPPAKDIAAVLGVNRNTVLTALRMLRDEGLVDFRRGRGVIVAGTPARSEVVEHARALVRFARSRGYERDELVQIIRSVS
jgi:GntR family transcriptional regulator